MKYKKIMFFFGVCLAVSLALRFIQLNHIIETSTGFYKQEFSSFGGYITAITFFFAALVAVFSFTSHRSPEHPPKPNLPLSFASVFFAISIVGETIYDGLLSNFLLWQLALLRISAILFALFLIASALKIFLNIPIHSVLYSLFGIYLIFKIIFCFSSISSLALISDNILLIAGYCASLVFAVCYAKLYNGMDTEKGFKRLMASGFVAVILCFTQSIPHIIYNLLNSNSYLHTAMHTSFNLLFMGLFILSFLLSHFSKKNACE